MKLFSLRKTWVSFTKNDTINCIILFYFSGVRVFIPNFVQIDELDCKQNLMKIENAGVLFPMSKFTNKCH